MSKRVVIPAFKYTVSRITNGREVRVSCADSEGELSGIKKAIFESGEIKLPPRTTMIRIYERSEVIERWPV